MFFGTDPKDLENGLHGLMDGEQKLGASSGITMFMRRQAPGLLPPVNHSTNVAPTSLFSSLIVCLQQASKE
jgi:hypothetical protein